MRNFVFGGIFCAVSWGFCNNLDKKYDMDVTLGGGGGEVVAGGAPRVRNHVLNIDLVNVVLMNTIC